MLILCVGKAYQRTLFPLRTRCTEIQHVGISLTIRSYDNFGTIAPPSPGKKRDETSHRKQIRHGIRSRTRSEADPECRHTVPHTERTPYTERASPFGSPHAPLPILPARRPITRIAGIRSAALALDTARRLQNKQTSMPTYPMQTVCSRPPANGGTHYRSKNFGYPTKRPIRMTQQGTHPPFPARDGRRARKPFPQRNSEAIPTK